MHTTNYRNLFIEVAEDCPADTAEIPPQKGNEKTVARLQYDMVKNNPYRYTSDDVIFTVYAIRNGIPESEYQKKREIFFSRGQACLRSSPLTKRYGWGIHHNEEEKIALFAVESKEYRELAENMKIQHKRAMRNRRR